MRRYKDIQIVLILIMETGYITNFDHNMEDITMVHIRYDDFGNPISPSNKKDPSKRGTPRQNPNKFTPPKDNRKRRRESDNNNDSSDSDDEEKFNNLLRIVFLGGPPPDQNDDRDENSAKKLKLNEPECKNPNCNHKTLEEDPTPVTIPDIRSIDTLDDMLTLGKSYHCKKNREFCGMNLRLLCNLVVPLTELRKMVGMENVKNQIVNQILFFIRGFNKVTKCGSCVDCVYNLPCAKNQDEMLHTVITGPPGTGKTQMGKILGQVYKEMGILENGELKLVTRSDLVAKYLGQTAKKTQDVIDSCKGGVMFIDEAYALGHSEGRDSFSKECLDTLNQNLSERRDFLCIIAGYADQLEECFFTMNEGLRRRFTFRYDITGYSSDELMKIFELKADASGWQMCYNVAGQEDQITNVESFFRMNHRSFPNFGGDMETLILSCKIVHSRGMTDSAPLSRVITLRDLEEGFKNYIEGRRYDKAINKDDDEESVSIYN